MGKLATTKIRTIYIITTILVVLMLSACNPANQQEPQGETRKSSDIGVEETEAVPVSTEETMLTTEQEGYYTLDKCLTWGGVFIAYDDGSFDSYIDGGYCDNADGVLKGMYLPDRIAQRVPIVDSDTKIVVFAKSDYSLELYPINGEVSVIQMRSDDGYEGYGRLDGMIETASIYVSYINGEWERIYPTYINGKPSAEYEAEIVEWSVTPYKGMSTTVYRNQLIGFQEGTTVTLGMAQGTKLIETSYTADATYYDCKADHNDWREDDVYYPSMSLTSEGYANVDFSGIPNGRYIMVYWSRSTNGTMSYNASLLILDN